MYRDSKELKRAKMLFVQGKISEDTLRWYIKQEVQNKIINLKIDRKVI